MKKIIIVLITTLTFFIGFKSISAKEITWNLFQEKFINNYKSTLVDVNDYKFEVYSDKLAITYNGKNQSYTFLLNYNDGIISYVNNRSNLTDAQRIEAALFDQMLIMEIYSSLAELYELNEVTPENFLEDAIKEKIINITYGEKLSYEEKTEMFNSHISVEEVKNFSVNLEKANSVYGIQQQITTTTTNESKITTTNQSKITTTIENPKTADKSNQLYIVIGVIALAGVTGLGVKLVTSKE